MVHGFRQPLVLMAHAINCGGQDTLFITAEPRMLPASTHDTSPLCVHTTSEKWQETQKRKTGAPIIQSTKVFVAAVAVSVGPWGRAL